MREGGLLSPHRARPRPAETHDRRIVTDAPNVMWATCGTQIATVRDGRGVSGTLCIGRRPVSR